MNENMTEWINEWLNEWKYDWMNEFAQFTHLGPEWMNELFFESEWMNYAPPTTHIGPELSHYVCRLIGLRGFQYIFVFQTEFFRRLQVSSF